MILIKKEVCKKGVIIEMNKKLKRINKKIISIMCIATMVFMMTGCKEVVGKISTNTQTTGTYPVTVGGVEIKAQPQKVAVISANIADVALTLKKESQIIAVSEESTQPEYLDITKVTTNDVSTIKAAQPDLIICDPLSENDKEALSALNISFIEIYPATNREDYERLFGEVSAVFSGAGDGYNVGVEKAKKIFTTMDSIQRSTRKKPQVNACYLYDLDGMSVGISEFGTIIMEYAGLTNILSTGSERYYKAETLQNANPDVIFCAPGLKSQLESNSDFSTLAAVRNGKVLELSPSYMQWQGRTIQVAAAEMASFAFPELEETQSQEPADPTQKIENGYSSENSSNSENSNSESYPSSSENSNNSKTSSKSDGFRTLSLGDIGEDVTRMQMRLEELGYLTIQYSDTLGQYTQVAVKEFQEENDLEATGIADPETQEKLFSSSAISKP